MNETPNAPPKARRWLWPVLVLSLALNLLIVGIVAGSVFSSKGPRGRDNLRPPGVIGAPFFQALPKEERRAILSDIARNDDRIKETRESLRARFEAFLTAVRADPFVPDDVAAVLSEQRVTAVKRQEIGEELLLKRLESMSAEERASYADSLEKSLKRLRRR